MPSFPLIKELPQVIGSKGWRWEKYHTPSFPAKDFWLGTDQEGNRWLTKLRGAFYAYRELVFARLAQKMGWSCQSSVFLKLDAHSVKTLGVTASKIHAAHWFMEEHPHAACSTECPLGFLIGKTVETVDDLHGSEIKHLLDWPKSEFAAYIFGGNEPPGRFFTAAHEFVIIDSEQMFASGPSDPSSWQWWNQPDGRPSQSGRALALQACRDFNSLASSDMDEALATPQGVRIQERWPIAPKLKESRKFAAEYLASRAKN